VRATAAGQPVFTPVLAGLVLGEYRRLASGVLARGGMGRARPPRRAGPALPGCPSRG
jgi:hypothetical protein